MKNKIYAPISLWFIFLFLTEMTIASAQINPRPVTIFERLAQEEGSKMTLEMDLTTLVANKRTDNFYPGTLVASDGTTYKVEVKPRGKYRRRIAEIPPLKIKFKKKALTAEGLDTLNEVKLVLPCYDDKKGDELVVKEYLAYRMFEKVSGAAIRARLIRLSLRDNHVESSSKRSVMAILLEDEEDLAARLNGQIVEKFGLQIDSFITSQTALMVMFQYMIGNTDWDLAMHRNVRLVEGQSGKITPVPYDFDFSGFVSAPYASPSSESGLKSVQDRFLMSNGLKSETLKRATNQLKAAKKDLLDLCHSKFLSREAEEEIVFYLNTFFDQLSQSEALPVTLKMPLMD
jgi:hypothetical protein